MTLSHPESVDPPLLESTIARRAAASALISAGRWARHRIMNIWIPDGSKDQPYDRFGPRRRLIEALDE